MQKCVSNTALLEWADENRPKSETLTKEDRKIIGEEYTKMEAKLKQGKAA